MAVFICSVLGDDGQHPQICKPEEILETIVRNDMLVWKYWRKKVLNELALFWKWKLESSFSYEPSIQVEPENQIESKEYKSFTENNTKLLEDLICDA